MSSFYPTFFPFPCFPFHFGSIPSYSEKDWYVFSSPLAPHSPLSSRNLSRFLPLPGIFFLDFCFNNTYLPLSSQLFPPRNILFVLKIMLRAPPVIFQATCIEGFYLNDQFTCTFAMPDWKLDEIRKSVLFMFESRV